ncbi:MAG: 50S ribosomal protein L19, partial [Candidatus Saccharibacteria bacterium]|nr:50S ribosomal protein L19 [Candidatus Saccharibacteria bacterium]
PLVEKIEITKRAKVRRNNLSYLRDRSGKSARLKGKDFDRVAVNDTTVEEPEVEVVETPEEAIEASAEATETEKTEEKTEA